MSSSATKPMVWYGYVCGLMDSMHTQKIHSLAFLPFVMLANSDYVQYIRENVPHLTVVNKQL